MMPQMAGDDVTEPAGDRRTRLAVFCDFSYRRDGARISAELPFSLFLLGLGEHFGRLVLIGRLDPSGTRFPYEMPEIDLEPLPYYASGADLRAVIRALPTAMRRFWRLLARVEIVWVLGPNPPQALAFVLLGMVRRRRVVLGVRQRLPELIRHRHPRRPHVWFAALILEHAFRLLARRQDVVVVGPELARVYAHSRRVHQSFVSLLAEADLASAAEDGRSYEGSELNLLSVGRLDPEKNPLLLIEVLRNALDDDPRWRLHVCGDGSLRQAMATRAAELGVSGRVTLHGHVPFGDELWRMYRSSHALLHVSMTEGVPQVLLEAFAARLPVVATAVGGVPEIVADRGLVVPPQDPTRTAAALRLLLDEPGLRRERVDSASAYVREHTMQAEVGRLAEFLEGR
jgi:glycosyltransferase involved in cell wall biosynthesis